MQTTAFRTQSSAECGLSGRQRFRRMNTLYSHLPKGEDTFYAWSITAQTVLIENRCPAALSMCRKQDAPPKSISRRPAKGMQVPSRERSRRSSGAINRLLLGLFNPYLSTCQKWESFKKNQITSSAVINYIAVMAGECPETQSFIYTHPRILENVCQYITGQKNISTSKEFRVSTCKKMSNTSCSYGNAHVQLGVICLTCRNRKPVQFVNMGNCYNRL